MTGNAGPPAAAGTRRAHALTALALALATLAVYAQVRNHELLIYDDPDYIIENPNLRVPPRLGEAFGAAFATDPYLGNWAPLTLLSLRLDYELYGIDSGRLPAHQRRVARPRHARALRRARAA